MELYHGYSARTLLRRGRSRRRASASARWAATPTAASKSQPPARRGDPGPRHDPRRRHARRHLDPVPRALRRRARTRRSTRSASRPSSSSPATNPFGNNRVDPHPGLPEPGQRLRRRLHVQHGREDGRGRPDPGARLEVRRPEPPARVRALPRPPVHRRAARPARSRSPPAPRRSPRAATSPWARWRRPGALVVGDGAGFVNMEKIKGIHYAILLRDGARPTRSSRRLAADDTAKAAARRLPRRASRSAACCRDLRHARNYRQSFRWGIYPGAPLSLVQSRLPGRLGHGAGLRGDEEGRAPRPAGSRAAWTARRSSA